MDKSDDEASPQANAAGLTLAPYFADPDQLPAPLPTEGEIVNSTDVLKTGFGRHIVRVGQHFVVKYGPGVSLTEGENMLYVRGACGIPTPHVYALYTKTQPNGRKRVFIVMEYIDGEPLISRWDTMSREAKSDMSRRMRSMLDKMRSIPSPGYYGCIGRRPLEDRMFWTSPNADRSKLAIDGPTNGPFDTEQQLNRALINKYLLIGGRPDKARFYSRVVPRVLANHVPVFTHGYPSYWEYTYAMVACGRWESDWHEYVADMLEEEYPNEYLWFEMFVRELWS